MKVVELYTSSGCVVGTFPDGPAQPPSRFTDLVPAMTHPLRSAPDDHRRSSEGHVVQSAFQFSIDYASHCVCAK